MNTEYARPYLLYGLEATPDILDHLLRGVTDPAVYDRRPDPDRFTLREVLAHLADWDVIFRERLALTVAGPKEISRAVEIADVDEGRLAIQNGYDRADPDASRRLLCARRPALVSLLRGLSADQWERAAAHEVFGPLTVQDQAAHVLGHDAYHLRQIVRQLSAS